MPLFIWKPSYAMNIPEIDIQHQRLVGLINELYDAMKEARGQEVVDFILDELQTDIQEHFNTEERYMEKHQYPGFEAHREEHRGFGTQVIALQELSEHGGRISTSELLSFLCHWLRDHLSGSDKEFGKFFGNCR